MNLFKRIASVSLGVGLFAASAPAFADHDFEVQPRSIFAAYDRNGDRWVSLQEFQAYDLGRCRMEFAQLDYDNDGILTREERSSVGQVECEALNVQPRHLRRPRFGGRVGYRQHSPYFEIRIGGHDRGLTWAEARHLAAEMSSQDFDRVDCSDDGWISRRELRMYRRTS